MQNLNSHGPGIRAYELVLFIYLIILLEIGTFYIAETGLFLNLRLSWRLLKTMKTVYGDCEKILHKILHSITHISDRFEGH